MNFYTGDLHFGHENVLKFDKRPFSSVDEMDKAIIDLWNSRVTKNDQVYILGDFAYRNERPFSWYLKQLKGQKHLIIGNHDRKLLKDQEAMGYFVSVDHYLEVKDNGKRVILSHYPLGEWNGFYRESWLMYGHIHNSTEGVFQYMKTLDRALNVGCMINNFTPCTFDEVVNNNRLFKESV